MEIKETDKGYLFDNEYPLIKLCHPSRFSPSKENYFKVENLFGELDTDRLRKEARRNLGITSGEAGGYYTPEDYVPEGYESKDGIPKEEYEGLTYDEILTRVLFEEKLPYIEFVEGGITEVDLEVGTKMATNLFDVKRPKYKIGYPEQTVTLINFPRTEIFTTEFGRKVYRTDLFMYTKSIALNTSFGAPTDIVFETDPVEYDYVINGYYKIGYINKDLGNTISSPINATYSDLAHISNKENIIQINTYTPIVYVAVPDGFTVISHLVFNLLTNNWSASKGTATKLKRTTIVIGGKTYLYNIWAVTKALQNADGTYPDGNYAMKILVKKDG